MHVHGVVDAFTHALGRVILENRGNDRELAPFVEPGAGQPPRRVEGVGVGGKYGQRLLHALEAADLDAELASQSGVGAGCTGRQGGAGRRQRRQGNAAPDGQSAHQHLPALPHLFLAADHRVERQHDVDTAIGPVLEHLHRRQMTPADLHTRRIGRHQRDGDADIFVAAQQPVGILELEGQPHDSGDRTQCDVALVPVETDGQLVAALAADQHAGVGHRRSVRSGFRAGQRETGNLAPIGQAR